MKLLEIILDFILRYRINFFLLTCEKNYNKLCLYTVYIIRWAFWT